MRGVSNNGATWYATYMCNKHSVQDDPAWQLYKRAGYVVRARDLVLVRLLGLDQRKLLYKRLGGKNTAV